MNDLEKLLDLLSRNNCIHSLTPFKQSTKSLARDLHNLVAGKIQRVYSDFDGSGHSFVKFNKTEVLDFTLGYLKAYKLVNTNGRKLKLTKHALACLDSRDFMYSVTYPYIQKQYNNSKSKKDFLRTISDLIKLKSSERNILISYHNKSDNEKEPTEKEISVASKIKGGKSTNVIWYSTHLYLVPRQSLMLIYNSLTSRVSKNNNLESNNGKSKSQKVDSDKFDLKQTSISDEKEQEEFIKTFKKSMTREQIIDQLINLKDYKSKEVTSKLKLFNRDNKTVALLKIIRDFKCQICGITILKKDGSNYIEAAHIKAKKEKGKETPENIILLCPNHHKEFDLGKRKIICQNKSLFEFALNGKNYKIKMNLT
jgi:hypothetical protein